MDYDLQKEAYRQLLMVYNDIKKSPSIAEFQNHRETTLSAQKIIKLHGKDGWTKAKRMAGIPEDSHRRKDSVGETKWTEKEMIEKGLELAEQLGMLPGWNDWIDWRKKKTDIPSEWQIYRRFGGSKDAWRFFQYLLYEEAQERSIVLPKEEV